jgi:branched-chain amino acid transport system ATP-binding protein
VFNCITGFYKPTEGMMTLRQEDGSTYLLERLPGHSVNWKARVARTFQNIRLFTGMTVLENLLVAQHNKLMIASGFTVLGLLGIGPYREDERKGDREGDVLAREDPPHRPRRRSRGRSSLRRPAPPRDRAGHVHRPAPAYARRAGGGPTTRASQRVNQLMLSIRLDQGHSIL